MQVGKMLGKRIQRDTVSEKGVVLVCELSSKATSVSHDRCSSNADSDSLDSALSMQNDHQLSGGRFFLLSVSLHVCPQTSHVSETAHSLKPVFILCTDRQKLSGELD